MLSPDGRNDCFQIFTAKCIECLVGLRPRNHFVGQWIAVDDKQNTARLQMLKDLISGMNGNAVHCQDLIFFFKRCKCGASMALLEGAGLVFRIEEGQSFFYYCSGRQVIGNKIRSCSLPLIPASYCQSPISARSGEVRLKSSN